MSLRKIILTMHLWIGVAAALLILALAVSGAMLVYENEIDRLLNPKLLTVAPQPGHVPLQQIGASIHQQFGPRPINNFGVNSDPGLAWQVILGGKPAIYAFVNPHTGQILGTRTPQTWFTQRVHMFHTNLLTGRNGERFVAYGTLCLAFLMVSGLILWWKRKLLTIRTAGSWRRINFDLHHLSGIYSALFLIVVVFTGLLMSFPNALYPVVELFTGSTDREGPEDTPESTPVAGVQAITLDQVLGLASAQLPGANPTFIAMPRGPKGVYTINFKFPEDHTPGGRSQVVLDRYSGAILWKENARQETRGVKFSNIVRPLHTGDVLGPSKIFYALASFSVVVQAVTGVLIWVFRWRKNRRPGSKAEPAEGPV